MLPPSISKLLLSTNNIVFYAFLSLSLYLILSFLKIPVLFLQGLHTYIHPDDVNPNPNSSGLRTAIRRPGDSSEPVPKPKKKSKGKFEFDENKAQIFRLKLNEGQLQSRLYFTEFHRAFNFTVVSLSCLLLHRFLPISGDSVGVLVNGTLIPILLGVVGVFRLFFLIARTSFERSASKRLEKELSLLLGILGFLFGLAIVFGIFPSWVFGFGFESLDGFGKFTVAAFMGCLTGLLHIPASRNARAFWLGTDQIRCNLAIVCCGRFGRMLLYASHLLVVFTSLLWITPFSELLVSKNIQGGGRIGSHSIRNVGHADQLMGNVGMPRSDFDNFRLGCLLVLGLLQLVNSRLNVQMFLNEAVLSWYQRLHASKVPDLDFSRAKVFLHNHYFCLVALQFFAPPALVLIFLGLSQIDDNLFENFKSVCSLLPCSALVKEVALFMAWWVVFVWALFTSASLALYRRGILYVS